MGLTVTTHLCSYDMRHEATIKVWVVLIRLVHRRLATLHTACAPVHNIGRPVLALLYPNHFSDFTLINISHFSFNFYF